MLHCSAWYNYTITKALMLGTKVVFNGRALRNDASSLNTETRWAKSDSVALNPISLGFYLFYFVT